MTKTRKRTKAASAPQPAAPVAAPAAAPPGTLRMALVGLALVVAIWTAYWGVLSSDFICFDDPSFIVENPMVRQGVTPRSAAWACTAVVCANWHPITLFSHMLDVQLFGLNAGRHHGMNLLIHTLNALLLLLLLESMTGAFWRSALVAALFALHPLHVESVAWIAERKDVLSTSFWFLTLAAWLAYIRSKKPRWYGFSILLCAFGLMSKAMLVTLPFTLLLLDFWPLDRLAFPLAKSPYSVRTLLGEKIPFFLLSAVSSIVTFAVQRGSGAVVGTEAVSLPGRMANAVWAYSAYLLKAAWPTSLAIFYPLTRHGHAAWQVALASIVLLAITAGSLLLWKKAPYFILGWLWFLGTLVPVIGLVQVGGQSMADRYTYVPFVGIFVALAWGLAALAEKGPSLRFAAIAAGGLALAALYPVTRTQVSYWANNASLFGHALDVTSDNYLAHNDLGLALFNEGKQEEGLSHLREAIRIKPDYSKAHDNLGIVLGKMGNQAEALEHLRLAMRYGPRSATACVNMGNALARQGQFDLAAEQYRQAIQLKPDSGEAHYNLGLTFFGMKRFPEAREEFEASVRLSADSADAHFWLGRMQAGSGQADAAVGNYHEAIRLKPDSADWQNELGMVLHRQNRFEEAARQFQGAIRLKPDSAEFHNNLGMALGALGRMPEAIGEFREALRCRPEYAEAHNNLGLALAQEDRIPEALAEFREAVRIRPDFARARENLRHMESAAGGTPPP